MTSPDSPQSARFPFNPVALRKRADGWTPERQSEFIEAPAESGCVEDACKRVGMSDAAAYQLRGRPEAYSFRMAWDAALDHAIRRLSDNAYSRALNGVARPVFYKGEQVGERRYFNERLTQFLLRYRDPGRYGAWRDQVVHEVAPDSVAGALVRLIAAVEHDASCLETGEQPSQPLRLPAYLEGGAMSAQIAELAEALAERERARSARSPIGDASDADGE